MIHWTAKKLESFETRSNVENLMRHLGVAPVAAGPLVWHTAVENPRCSKLQTSSHRHKVLKYQYQVSGVQMTGTGDKYR